MSNSQRNDIPWPLALILLGVIGFFLWFGGRQEAVESFVDELNHFIESYSTILFISALAAFLNLAAVTTFIIKNYSIRRQGRKLQAISGKQPNASNALPKVSFWPVFAGTVVLCTLSILSNAFTLKFGSQDLGDTFTIVGTINLSLASVLVFTWFGRACRVFKRKKETEIPPFPKAANQISLGTTFPSNDGGERWVEVSNTALCGNVLVTGSIGSGKTQGTILPYFRQILQNFEPKPSILAIDPKGTFIPKAIEICQNAGLGEAIVHVKFDGKESFNPIFVDGMLENGRFVDIAQMIRAAAVNSIGKGSTDSPFWEMSAFNLTKNGLIYVAAVHGYFTLNDLYAAILDAAKPEFLVPLRKALNAGSLSQDAKFNVEQAHRYFESEFAAFDEKVKAGVLATATAFLNQFQEYRASRVFCPPKDERSIKSMDEIVDQGKFLLFDISSPGLARTMGTFIKLHYQQSVLNRLTIEGRKNGPPALLIIDEYQDVATTGYGSLIGDDRFLAKGREAQAITIAATQSLSSLENSIGKSTATKELCQNFRTRIACHSSDLLTIKTFQELVGEVDREKKSHSYSEMSQNPKRNLLTGGFESESANLSESISTSTQREWAITGKDFLALEAFEAYALVYDGNRTQSSKLCLKPSFLSDPATSHRRLKSALAGVAVALCILLPQQIFAFPNVCDVVTQPAFTSCMNLQVSACMCPGYPPRPCAHFSYYIPETMIELTGEAGQSKFADLPGASAQLSNLSTNKVPYGTEGNDFIAFHARTITTPYSSSVLASLPCGGASSESTCFGSMSEHLGQHWSSGLPDSQQPAFLAWMQSPKACLLYGAAKSVLAGAEPTVGSGSNVCSFPIENITTYPPSAHSVCNGWGIFFPRVGMYDGPSQTTGALMIASRMKSLGTEVFQGVKSSMDEKWQMIYPSGSQCFLEGQNTAMLELPLLVNDWGRVRLRPKDYLFAVWRKVSCCKEYSEVPVAMAAIAALQAGCPGLGGLN